MGVSHAESLENKAFWWGLGHSSPVSRSGLKNGNIEFISVSAFLLSNFFVDIL